MATVKHRTINYVEFWWRCALLAFEGTITRANALYSIIGAAIVWVVLAFFRYQKDAPTAVVDVIGFGVEWGLMGLGATWLVLFAGRLLAAPAQLHHAAEARADRLDRRVTLLMEGPRSDLFIRFADMTAMELTPSYVPPEKVPGLALRGLLQVLRITVTNTGDKVLLNCQLKSRIRKDIDREWEMKMDYFFSSEIFKLTLKDSIDLPILTFPFDYEDSQISQCVWYVNNDKWTRAENFPKQQPGKYYLDLEVKSDGTYPRKITYLVVYQEDYGWCVYSESGDKMYYPNTI